MIAYRLEAMDGRLIAKTDSGNFCLTGNWGPFEWLKEMTADEFRCNQDDVDSTEVDEHTESVTACGVEVARLITSALQPHPPLRTQS